MKVTVLGSGSTGNATLVQADGVNVMIDAGFSGRDIERRLRAVDVDPESLAGVVITHDHGDHTRGMGVIARRFGLPIYLTDRTREACAGLFNGSEDLRSYGSSRPFRIGPFEVQPFLTVHDAVDPVAIAIRHVESGHKVGVATDLGRPTTAVHHALAQCHLLVLEANHDEIMLRNGPYPWSVKQRIASSHGHLSNRAAGDLARALHHPGLCGVVLAHLSEHCNDPELARDVVAESLDAVGYGGMMVVARQDEPLEPIDVESLRAAKPGQLELF